MPSQFSRRAIARASLAALASACVSAPRPAPDLILHGGPIYTGSEETPVVEALRVRDGTIAFAGALEEARAGGAGARSVDLRGAAAFPGFADAHVHLIDVGLVAMRLDLTGVASLAELQARLRTYAAAHAAGPIIGEGWIETHWPERRFPARADLDAIVADRPVVLGRIDGHAVVVNSAALALAGIGAATQDPAGGRIERDSAGAPTGMLIDRAVDLVAARVPAPSRAMKRAALKQAAQLYAARGWTRAASMSASLEDVALFAELASSGELPIRADLYVRAEDADAVLARGPFPDPTGRVHVRGLKLFMDGALGSRGAALLQPYSDAPGEGLLVTPPDVLRALYRRARERGVQVATHAIGDRGNRLVLDAYRDVFAGDTAALSAARWRIEHAQVVSPQDIPRFAALGIIASMQPSHAISDLHFAPARLGPGRLAGAYAWRSLLNTGAFIAAGSDAPVEKGDPLIEFYAATFRRDLSGFAGPDWRLEETVSRSQALRMLTWAPAYAVFEERSRGTLAPGKRADVSAFSVDLMQAPFPDIPRAHAALTICDGAIVHDAL